MATDPADPTDPLVAAQRANRVLRERVAELERQLQRFGESVPSPQLGATLREREALMAEAERVVHMGSWVWNVVSNEVQWSEELYRILGYDPRADEASSEAFFARVHPEDLQRVRDTSIRGITSGTAEQVDYRVLWPDGTVRHVTMDAALLFGADGTVHRAVGTVLDVTEAREAARALEKTADLLADAQRIANMGSFELDLETNRLTWSDQMYQIADIDRLSPPSAEAFVARLHADDREQISYLIERAAHGEVEPSRARIVREDGSIHHVDMMADVIRDDRGKPVSIRGTVSDVTKIVRLEAQFHQSQKMEAIGQLAGGLAHDFNNLLTVIISNAELLATRQPSPELDDIARAANIAVGLTSRLLTLGRRTTHHTRVLRLSRELADARLLIQRAAGDAVMHFELGDTWLVRADSGQLQQVLLNLVLNACDAMPSGGAITLTSVHRQLEPAEASRHQVRAGDYVVLAITDTGIGMDEPTCARVFEPFFTTKPAGQGTGLGLSMVFGAMKQVGGFVDVRSRLGAGTTFELWFPRADGELVEQAAPQTTVPQLAAAVLLVEDDVAVARATQSLLESIGCRVRTASSPRDAVASWSAQPADVLVTDIRMPGMSGVKLDERLREQTPDLRTLFITGHSPEQIDLVNRRARAVVLMKPFRRDELIAAITQLLG